MFVATSCDIHLNKVHQRGMWTGTKCRTLTSDNSRWTYVPLFLKAFHMTSSLSTLMSPPPPKGFIFPKAHQRGRAMNLDVRDGGWLSGVRDVRKIDSGRRAGREDGGVGRVRDV